MINLKVSIVATLSTHTVSLTNTIVCGSSFNFLIRYFFLFHSSFHLFIYFARFSLISFLCTSHYALLFRYFFTYFFLISYSLSLLICSARLSSPSFIRSLDWRRNYNQSFLCVTFSSLPFTQPANFPSSSSLFLIFSVRVHS